MKRIVCLLVCLVMLCSFAFAEEAVITEVSPEVLIDEYEGGAIPYEMRICKLAPNKKSMTYIEYPYFSDYSNNRNTSMRISILNEMVFDRVIYLAAQVYLNYGYEKPIDISYKCNITLNNGKLVSLVFWGDLNSHEQYEPVRSNERHDRHISAITVNLSTMREERFVDMYNVNDERFEQTVYNAAHLPINPEMVYVLDSMTFDEQMSFLHDDFESPMSMIMSGYLLPEGVVIILSESHAGGDYFLAQVEHEHMMPFWRLDIDLLIE